jgi:hypothetical protein
MRLTKTSHDMFVVPVCFRAGDTSHPVSSLRFWIQRTDTPHTEATINFRERIEVECCREHNMIANVFYIVKWRTGRGQRNMRCISYCFGFRDTRRADKTASIDCISSFEILNILRLESDESTQLTCLMF